MSWWDNGRHAPALKESLEPKPQAIILNSSPAIKMSSQSLTIASGFINISKPNSPVYPDLDNNTGVPSKSLTMDSPRADSSKLPLNEK